MKRRTSSIPSLVDLRRTIVNLARQADALLLAAVDDLRPQRQHPRVGVAALIRASQRAAAHLDLANQLI
jgi:hypothetical protein